MNKKKRLAKEILESCNIISLQAINETIYVLSRKFDFQFKELNSIINFLKENFLIKNLDIFILENAISLMQKYKFSSWDSMMLASAIECGCSIIYSEDLQHKQTIEGTLKIINPFIK